jgi:hypothetical protein
MFFISWKMTKQTGELVHKNSASFRTFCTIQDSERHKNGVPVLVRLQKHYRKQFFQIKPLKVENTQKR